MGTRGLTCVVLNGEIKVAQYGQCDHYPGGQGLEVLNFVRDLIEKDELQAFKDRVASVVGVDDDYVRAKWDELGADGSGFISMEISDRMAQEYPQFQRDLAAKVLQLIHEEKIKEVHLQTDFAADSLFCDWAWVVDLDEEVIEAHKGFQRGPHNSGRFADLKVDEGREGEYWPVAEAARFPFHDLPDKDVFVAVCEGEVLDRMANLDNEPPADR